MRVSRKYVKSCRERLVVDPLDVVGRRRLPLLLGPSLDHGRCLQHFLNVNLKMKFERKMFFNQDFQFKLGFRGFEMCIWRWFLKKKVVFDSFQSKRNYESEDEVWKKNVIKWRFSIETWILGFRNVNLKMKFERKMLFN